MDDDDWGLSFDELDSLERNAALQFASRSRSSAPVDRCLDCPEKKIPGAEVSSPPPKDASFQFLGSVSTNNVVGSSRNYTLSPAKKKTGKELEVKISKDQPGRIAVHSAYHPDLVTALRTISGKSWDQPRKIWTFPERELEDVLKAIRSLPGLEATIDVQSSLAVHAACRLQPPSADRSAECQEDEVEILSTPPQSISSEGNNNRTVPPLESPKGIVPRVSQDGGWKSPKNSKAQISEDGVSSQLSWRKCTVGLFLHSTGKIAAKCNYDAQLVASFRQIPKSEWDAKERLWMFPFSSLADAEKILRNVPDRSVNVEPLIPLVRRALEATTILPDLQGLYDRIPSELKSTLMDFQVDGVRFALRHGGRALIADEMGLGKTLQALAVVSCLKEDWPVLVIVPSSLRVNWATMVEKWLKVHPSDITIVMSQGSSREGFNIVRSAGKKQLHLNGFFNIVSYDVLSKLEETISRANFNIVIADESHYMKNPTAKRTNACIPVLQKAKYALLLTGTPALSRPIEMFKQLEALQPGVYRRMDEYGWRYCMGGFFGVWQGASNHEELHALVKSTVMIRRLKKDVMKQLPKKRREQVFISLDDRGLRKIRALFFELEDAKKQHRSAIMEKNTEESNRLNFLERQLLAQIYTDSAEAKLPAVQDYLTTIIEGGCKFLVFAHHQCMLDGIQDLLEKKKVNFIRIDGKTPAASRQELVKKFQEKPDVLVALLGIRAAGVGLTLTAASTVIFAEMSWTPGDLVQAEDRVHRIGQESAVNIYYLHAQESIDDLIWETVQHKLENLGQVLDGEEDSSMQVTSAPRDYLLAEGRSQENTLDPYLRPCVDNSAVPMHVAEMMSSSQAQATLDAFLRPFEISRLPVSERASPMAFSEGYSVMAEHKRKQVGAAGIVDQIETINPMIPTTSEVLGDLVSETVSRSRFRKLSPGRKRSRFL